MLSRAHPSSCEAPSSHVLSVTAESVPGAQRRRQLLITTHLDHLALERHVWIPAGYRATKGTQPARRDQRFLRGRRGAGVQGRASLGSTDDPPPPPNGLKAPKVTKASVEKVTNPPGFCGASSLCVVPSTQNEFRGHLWGRGLGGGVYSCAVRSRRRTRAASVSASGENTQPGWRRARVQPLPQLPRRRSYGTGPGSPDGGIGPGGQGLHAANTQRTQDIGQ